MADTHEALAIPQEVLAERARQDAKWGEQNHPDGTGPDVMVLEGIDHYSADELDVAGAVVLAGSAKTATDVSAGGGMVTWRDILLEEVFETMAEKDPVALRTELIQVSAVAQQWIEAIDRRRMDEVHESRAGRRS